MTKGDAVMIRGAAGVVEHATVVEALPVEELPSLPGGRALAYTVVEALPVEELPSLPGGRALAYAARAVLEEYGIRAVSLIQYKFKLTSGEFRDVVFAAFEDANGRWCDLQGQRLEIRTLPAGDAV